ncbi:hypothetical protein F5Y17DRAFT_441748 [Xylariaceae sp. FL0594]|nr:hypothetical protein F5Y17DRAFT_441748 [Xylariaceae sp. FL0594]
MTTPVPAAGAAPAAADKNPFAKFEDFDLQQVFDKATPHAASLKSQNFVVEFGPERARIAFDLDADDFEGILEGPRDTKDYPIRWINIWNPSDRLKTGEVIGNHYEFSERLVRLVYMSAQKRQRDAPRRTRERRHRRRPLDVEAGAGGEDQSDQYHLESHSSTDLRKAGDEVMDMDDDNMELFMQVQNTANYFSTDQTKKALCIGAHWLHKRPKGNQEHSRKSMMPPKHWQWLTLCNDHTVLSIHQYPTFEAVPEKEDPVKWEAEELRNIRANTLDVLLQLSKQGFDLYKRKPLSLNSVRRPLSKWHARENNHEKPAITRNETGMSFPGTEGISSLADEGTSNLFYYLFEDYVAAGPLKTAESKLEQMTYKVLESTRPSISTRTTDIIPTLHYLSKDLRELKHLFENYQNLIRKVSALGKTDAQPPNGAEDTRKVMLTDSALSRFERLGDRLQFLMLNSIDGYLMEISALSNTHFNLTQQKDSAATARLTRSATLLAKLSVFFLPISFVTSYFSVQVQDLYTNFKGTDYWYSFAVIASLSFVSLFFFSRLLMFASDTLDDWALRVSEWFRKLGRRVGLEIPEIED